MCGIFGYYKFRKKDIGSEALHLMGTSLKHRGPDNLGIYQDATAGIGNSRLSIIDLKHGNQPMFSENKNLLLVQNGEIYNYKELKNELSTSGVKFKTSSDTEVLLKGIEKNGIDFLHKLNGMFAIAFYNKKEKVMHLIRDRFGVKPLYYYYDKDILIFSSEIKALFKLNINKALEKNNISTYLKLGYLPKEKTLFKNIYQLNSGSYLKLDLDGKKEHRWWKLSISTKNISIKKYNEHIDNILEDAVKIRTRSDVPFGAFLSGGLDSSLVLYYMSKILKKDIHAFTISFKNTKFDELFKAKKISKKLNLKHHVYDFKTKELKNWPYFIQYVDLPHSDLSFLATYYLSKMASNTVKMALSGDGADEFWGGYKRYRNFYKNYNDCPNVAHAFIKDNFIFSKQEIEKLLLYSDEDELEEKIKKINKESKSAMDPVNQLLYLDYHYLLPGNNLVKIDRMGMACSLEIRSPFMDYRLAELAFAIPGKNKLEPYGVKSNLKQIAEEKLGKDFIHQEKQMFSVPLSEWGDFNLNKIIDKLKIKDRALFNMDHIETMKNAYKKGNKSYLRQLRTILALELWFNLFFDSTPCEDIMDIFHLD